MFCLHGGLFCLLQEKGGNLKNGNRDHYSIQGKMNND